MSVTHKIISKKIVDALIDFFREKSSKNRLYESVKITDSFPQESANIPYVIISQNSNTQKRNDFTDFWRDNYNRVQLIPLLADNDLVGNNAQRVNLPQTIDFNPMWAWDTSVPLPSGSDISKVLFTSGTGPFDTQNISTGVIITVPKANTFEPTSIERAQEAIQIDPFTNLPVSNNMPDTEWVMAIGRTNNQFYLIYSGTAFSGNTYSGISSLPVSPDDFLINPPNMPSGVSIKLNDVLSDGDQYILRTFTDPNFISERFGGLYNISLTFDVGALSTIERDEISDMIERFLVENKYDLYNSYGISLLSWSKGGNTQEPHLTNDYLYKSNISTEALVEWHEDRGITLIDSLSVVAIPIGYLVNFSGSTYYAPGVYFPNVSYNNTIVNSPFSSIVVPSGI